MESRSEEPESTQSDEAVGSPPPHEDVTVRQDRIAEQKVPLAERREWPAEQVSPGEIAEVSDASNAELAGAKTVISKPRSSPVPAHPGTLGEPAKIASVLLGHQLGHFELQSLIGGGGMGAVFRARDTRLDRTVAIKVIPRVGEDAELQRRFRNEAQSAARLEHPNIARIYDVGEDSGWHYIVFEYIEGINLRDLVIRDGLLSIDDAVYYTRQIAEALEHASRKGVTHRDIKPSNVLITPDGAVKLVDMGLARAHQLEMSEDMTASGVTLGTFDYISPEQAKDPRDADVRSDIYSLGCTLFFSLTGRPPYGGGTPLQKLLSHGSSPLPDPNLYRAGVSENLVAILFKMMAKDPAARYRRPLDLIADLYQLAERENLTRSLSAGSISVVPGNRFLKFLEQHLPWFIAASILFLSASWLQLLSSASGELELSEPVPVIQASSRIREGDSGGGNRRNEASQANDDVSSSPVDADGPNNEIRSTNSEGAAANNGFMKGNGEISESSVEDAAKPPNLGPSLGAPQGDNQRDLSTSLNMENQTTTSDATEEAIRRIVRVVEPESTSLGQSGAKEPWFVESIQEAIDMAANDSRIDVIELGTQWIRSGPVRFPSRPLTIRGMTASTVWEIQSPVSREDRNRLSMIELNSPNLSIEKVHLLWRFPATSTDGGALFCIPDSSNTSTLRFQECSLTIENAARNPDVYALELRTGAAVEAERGATSTFEAASASEELSTVSGGTTSPSPFVAIKMSDVVVRGQLTMLSIDRPVRLEFLWENGLLAVDGGLLQCSAGSSAVSASPSRLRFILNDLTSATGEALLQLQLATTQSQPYMIDREANRCVFTLDEDVPMVALDGIGGNTSVQDFVLLRGRDNYYDAAEGRTQLILRATTRELQQVSLRTQEMLASQRPSWIQELSPQDFVSWKKSSLPSRPNHLAIPADYLQDGVVLPGFRYEKLPLDLPEIVDSGETGI